MARTSTPSVSVSTPPSPPPAVSELTRWPGVLMVVGSYFPEITGGGLQCRTVILALQSRVRFTVLATSRDATLPSFEEVDGIPVHRVCVDLRSAIGRARSLLRLVLVFLRLRKTFEIVHLHGFTRKSIPLIWLGHLTGKRIVYKMTSLGADDVAAVGQGPLASRALRRIDRFVSVSPGLSERYRQTGLPLAKLVFIPNGVDTVRFRPVDSAERSRLRASVGLPSDAPVIAFVGFFSRDKAPQVLVQAWCRIRKAVVPSPTLLLIGSIDPAHVEVDPRLVAEVRDHIRAERAESFVRFVDTTHDVPTFLQASDIFVLSSLREGLPNALMEAMACGLPCIASRLPGVTDHLIEDGVNGHLFSPGDCDDLAAALLVLLRDPSRRAALGARARATIEQRFSIDHTASLTEQLYHQLSIVNR